MKVILARMGFYAGALVAIGGAAHAQDATLADSPFMVNLDTQEYYTDNVFFSRPLYNEPRRGDWVTVVKPSIRYGTTFENGRFNAGISAALGRYARYTSENFDDLDFYTNGTYRFDPTLYAVWGLDFSRNHEARSSLDPSDQTGTRPTIYWKTSAYGAISKSFGDNSVKFGVTYDGYDFQDSATTVAPYTINNDDRDRDMFTVGTRFTHRLDEHNGIYAEGTLDIRKYRSTTDDNGYRRDSQGFRASAGWQTDIGENGKLELYGGLLYQNYRDSRFSDVVAPDFGGSYSWQHEGTSFTADLRRTLEETTLSGVSSYLNTTASFSASQDMRNNMRLYGGVSLSDLDFQNSSRRDQLTNVWMGARKYLTPYFYIGGEAGFEERDSSSPENDYTQSRIMARAGIDSQKAFDVNEAAGYNQTSGFYVGAGGNINHLGTMMDGPRQDTKGSLRADFGALGFGGRAIAGWGTDIDQTYLGIEGDLSLSSTDWGHSRTPGGRVFSVRERDSAGLSFIGGYRLPGGSLLYGRAGIRSTRFDTDYATAGSSASWSNRLLGLEYGIGLSTPLSTNLALALEYAQVRYADYQAISGNNTPDRYGNVEDSVRLALTYHFGGIPGAGSASAPTTTFAGTYWGVQAGFGTLNSRTQGERDAGSILTADFGDHGYLGGLLAGYNYQVNSFVLGAEVEASLARETWNQQRQPDGRTYWLGKDANLGVSGRVGYLVDSNTMLYGRAGFTASHFRNHYETNGVNISASGWHGAMQFGGGMEVGLSDNSRVRFDYSFADYGTLSLATPGGPETYKTKEQRFQIGYIRTF